MCRPISGLAADAVRRRSGDENVRQGEGEREPPHLPAQQEVLRQVTRRGFPVPWIEK